MSFSIMIWCSWPAIIWMHGRRMVHIIRRIVRRRVAGWVIVEVRCSKREGTVAEAGTAAGAGAGTAAVVEAELGGSTTLMALLALKRLDRIGIVSKVAL